MYEVRYSNPAARYLKKIKDKQLLAAFKIAIDELKKTHISEHKKPEI
jgi:hypothetical protein